MSYVIKIDFNIKLGILCQERFKLILTNVKYGN